MIVQTPAGAMVTEFARQAADHTLRELLGYELNGAWTVLQGMRAGRDEADRRAMRRPYFCSRASFSIVLVVGAPARSRVHSREHDTHELNSCRGDRLR